MRIGKHRGRSFEEVTRIDRPYCGWILRVDPSSFQKFHSYLQRVHGGLLEVGRHKGMFFNEVVASEPEYCVWVSGLKEPGGGFHDFILWLRKHFAPPPDTEEEEPQGKKQKVDECKICYDRQVNSVFVPCGHVLACFSCANSLDACPICKTPSHAIRTYHS